ncbi:hypothetical protein SPRG_18050 [Saprolegnia parasitica CBS 223.65]|uniref:Uncharacterized protein n=1 Tax=Saprolegnia parasitica (strain CBS 223.65) TaxID=695850 RepID=A0A067BQ22_SAPPC|nr:hypothetical protein SPRG_18050 [Saprolegnia parasitica CBS 223.65]KDO16426.1 hypothetical protein SPRG_18050 [Saprolegnia parasitica CBS 223.65]|eukprot:XP_012212867.1 hypothetical protein SPRG_18050 [Saprolegnia parasitica CBS 223.65]
MASVARRTAYTAQPPTSSTAPTVFIVSWNDFLCPTTFLSKRKSNQHVTKTAFANLDASIERILLHAKQFGTVFVLCEDKAATIEALCHKWLPRTARLFSAPELHSQIHLICAATAITPTWHAQIVYSICSPRLHAGNIVLAVCGSARLRASCLEVAKYVPVVPKIFAATEAAPSVNQATNLSRIVADNLSKAMQHPGPLDATI